MSSISLSALQRHLTGHITAYALAFFIGALCAAPYVYFAATPEYKGIALMGQDAEEHYLARIQAAYEGDYAMGNIFMPNKSVPYLIPGLGEVIVAKLGQMLNIAAPVINTATKVLFPACIFLLIYGFTFSISRSRTSALLAAAAGMLGTAIMSNPSELLALLQGASTVDGITWARPINPSLSGCIMFAALWMLYSLRNRGAHPFEITVLGSLIGLSLYVSVYTWSFLGVLLFLTCIDALWKKEFDRGLHICMAGALALAYSVPFLLNILQARAHTDYVKVAESLDITVNHSIELGVLMLMFLAIPALLWPKRLEHSRLFFILCGVALFVVLNQHVLSGFYLQPGHYHWYITKPLLGILLALVAAEWLGRVSPRHFFVLLCTLAIAVLCVHGILAQRHFYQKHAPEAQEAQAYAPLFEYLNQEPHTTLIANPALSIYAAIYTTADTPNHPYRIFYLSGPDNLEQAVTVEDKKATSTNPTTGGLVPFATIEDRFVLYRRP